VRVLEREAENGDDRCDGSDERCQDDARREAAVGRSARLPFRWFELHWVSFGAMGRPGRVAQ
jgi:hypothetical protein